MKSLSVNVQSYEDMKKTIDYIISNYVNNDPDVNSVEKLIAINTISKMILNTACKKSLLEIMDIIGRLSNIIPEHTSSALLCLAAHSLGSRSEKSNREELYKIKIIDNFDLIFPYYQYIGTEVKTKAGGFIDILAIDRSSKKHVIMELKLGAKNCARQLYGYAVDFEDPVLISITELDVKNKQNDIIYLTTNELDLCVTMHKP